MVFIIALVSSFSSVVFSDISFFPFTSLVGQIVFVEEEFLFIVSTFHFNATNVLFNKNIE